MGAGLGLSLDPTPQPQKSQLIQCGVWSPAYPAFTFIDVKLVIIPAAPPIFQVQLHWVVEVPFLWNLLCFLPQGGGGGMQAGSEALPLIFQPPPACPLPSPGTALLPHSVSPHKPSGQCPLPPSLVLWALTLSSGGSKSALRMW